jgi:hypothetical protein
MACHRRDSASTFAPSAPQLKPAASSVLRQPTNEDFRRAYARGTGIAKDENGNVVALDFDLDHGNDFDQVIAKLLPKTETAAEAYLNYSDITEDGVIALAQKCPNLTLIDIRSCFRIHWEDAELFLRFKKLRAIYVHWPADLTLDGADGVRENVRVFKRVLGDRVHVDIDGLVGSWRDRLRFYPASLNGSVE